MSWGKLDGRREEKWDTGTSTVPWLVGGQKAVASYIRLVQANSER